MAALHSALRMLGPASFSSIPTDKTEIKAFVLNAFSQAQLIIDSVPPPPIPDSATATRSRSNTSTSNASEISASFARSDPINPSHLSLQKEWGKPVRIAPKDNPLEMAVFKLAGKDGKGAWFARRSVHEGMGFKKWVMGLQNEFPESLEVQGAPGEGNIRGIGGERMVERIEVDGVGTIEVYHLSAQFPGPTTPRDFVTLLITSSSALGDFDSSSAFVNRPKSSNLNLDFRHFMVISKPCTHPDCPPRDGFIRGQYESVEFIREIPIKPKKRSSTTQLRDLAQIGSNPSSSDRNTHLPDKIDEDGKEYLKTDGATNKDLLPRFSLEEPTSAGGRRRGRTISFAESRGFSAKGEAVDTCQDDSVDIDEKNPVEWIMVTRSDPGGSVPRFLVERGTPSGIVADAGKFLDWAAKKELPTDKQIMTDTEDDSIFVHTPLQDLKTYQADVHLASIDDAATEGEEPRNDFIPTEQKMPATVGSKGSAENQQEGMLANVANRAITGVESYAPQILIDHLPIEQRPSPVSNHVPSVVTSEKTGGEAFLPDETAPDKSIEETSSISSDSSSMSFASAEDHFEPSLSRRTTSSLSSSLKNKGTTTTLSSHDKELAKLNERKRTLDEKLARLREKETKDKQELTIREEERLRKAEEKHAREIQKQEQRYKKEVAKLEARRARDAAKEEERKRKAEDKVERTRLAREKDELRQQLDIVLKERDLLKEQVGALQRENTALVAKMGKTGEGLDLLREVKVEIAGG